MIFARWKWCSLWTIAAFVAAACSSAPEPVDDGDELHLDDCVSERGQRLLTFCASKDAATLAQRQHGIAAGAGDDDPAEDFVALPVDGAPVRGERDAPITIHLFSDLRCSDCRAIYRRLSAEVEHRPGEVRLVFRHIPRDDAAQDVSRAAIAAADQGRFWSFVDALYADDEIRSRQGWPEVAGEADLDVARWENDRRMPTVDAVLEHDAIQAESVGVVDAPTFFVNGVRMVGGVALHELDEVIDAEREYVAAMEEAGLSGADISWRRILQNYEPVDWEEVERARDEMHDELHISHVPVGSSPQMGAAPADTLVTVVVFADFQCRFCAQAAGAWHQLVDRYGEAGLRVVFKHFPLPAHDGAEDAAAASVLAHRMDRFWPFHDALFFEGLAAEKGALEAKLREMGWTGEDFAAAINADAVRDAVATDRRIGEQVGVEGTPTTYVNGIQLAGAFAADELAPLIEDQLALAASIAELTGNRGDALYRDVVEANRGE